MNHYSILDAFGISPETEIRQTDKAYNLLVELPGVAKADIDVKVKDGVLTVKAERKKPEGELVRGDRWYGPLETSYRLSDTLDTEAMQAKHLDGVLHLVIPMKADTTAKSITVL